MKSISIRLIQNAELHLCRHIVHNQQLIWEMPASEAMPSWKFMTVDSTGGLLVGAFDDDTIVGHALLTPARDPLSEAFFLYLDMIGVLPEYQNGGLAEKMLRLAGETAQKRRVTSIQWTYDPLQTSNASLYIRKLGARAVRFYADYYGATDDDLLSATDRFWVQWDFNRVQQILPDSIIRFDDSGIEHVANPVAIEMPNDFSQLKKTEPENAAAFRAWSRSLFASLFGAEYFISGFVRSDEKNFYIASRKHSTLF